MDKKVMHKLTLSLLGGRNNTLVCFNKEIEFK